jgi:hypothetical protein
LGAQQKEHNHITLGSRDSAVGMETGYKLVGPGSIPSKTKFIFLLHRVQTDSGAHPVSYSMGTGGLFPWGLGVKLTTHIHVVPRSRKVEQYPLVSCSAYLFTLKMEAICSSETPVDTQRTTRRYISHAIERLNGRGEKTVICLPP